MNLRPFMPCVYRDDIKDVTAPPFDGITPEQEAELKKHAYNIAHLTLPHGPEGVEKARSLIEEWISDGIISQVDKETFIVLVQEFRLNSENIERIGVIGITDTYPNVGSVKPHENTFPGPVKERAALMKGMEAQLEPLFMTVLNNNFERVLKRSIAGRRPDRVFEEPIGVRNSLYFVNDSEKIVRVSEAISKDTAIVADGHHRLKAARTIAAQSQGTEADFWKESMVYVSSIYDRGLLISGVHRIVGNGFSLKQNSDRIESHFRLREREAIDAFDTIVIYDGKFKELIPRKGALESLFGKEFSAEDVVGSKVVNEILFSQVLGMENKDLESSVQYTHDVALAIRYVDSGKGNFAVIMPAWNKDAFIKQAMEGNVLPQKSTYFYPKIPSGVAIRKFDITNC